MGLNRWLFDTIIGATGLWLIRITNVHLRFWVLILTLFSDDYDNYKRVATTVFPVREYWTDIGIPKDFDEANGQYEKNFAGEKENEVV